MSRKGSSSFNSDSAGTTPSSGYHEKRRSILKKKDNDRSQKSNRELKFDESNVDATFHPIDKDYGFDRITEPDTPYPRDERPIDANLLASKLENLKAEEEENERRLEEHDEFVRKRNEVYKSEFRKAKEMEANNEDDDESESDKEKHKKFRNKRYLMASSEFKAAKKFQEKDDNNKDSDANANAI